MSRFEEIMAEIEESIEMAYGCAMEIVNEYERENLPVDPAYNLALATIVHINEYRRAKLAESN